MNNKNSFSLIVKDVQIQYQSLRARGKNRKDAISSVMEIFMDEMQDEEDSLAVMAGLVLALCKKRELTRELAEKTHSVIRKFPFTDEFDGVGHMLIRNVTQLIDDESMQGDEAIYKRKAFYKPNWQVGDTFAHEITSPCAEKVGIKGWSVIFYKVGEYVDESERHRQLMYVSLCPSGEEPINSIQLQNLGFLRMMQHDRGWDYLVQLVIRSKRDELSYQLTKIGNFLDVIPPADRIEENPLVSMPMFGCLKKGDSYPHYEEQICRLYRKHGRSI